MSDAPPADPMPYEREAIFRLLLNLGDAVRHVHGRGRPPKPKNIAPDWLPPTDWTPESDREEGDNPVWGHSRLGASLSANNC